MGNWLDLAAPYFEAVGRDVFEAYLNGHGFGRGRAGDTGALAYRRGRCLLEVDYYVEDSPNYSPMLNIGHVRRSFLRAHFAGIGLWYAVPEGAEARE